ncbi:MAG: hypothetical protein K8T25_12240 [Planctomycetia bacterium]|nr:hypothetical protein [Planctomycetia bacterium]
MTVNSARCRKPAQSAALAAADAPLRAWLGRGTILVLAMAGGGCDRTAANANSRPLVLLVSGDTAGWIVPCGCTSNQSGGLPRRGSYVGQLRQSADVVLVDVGGAPGGTQPYDRERFEAILRGELAMDLSAHNLGTAEARLGAAYLREIAGRLKVPFVSANLRDAAGHEIAPAARIVETGGQRIAIVGVIGEQLGAEKLNAGGLSVLPPQRAVLDAIEHLPAKCDAVVVLAYAAEQELTDLAKALPEVDMVLGGPTGQAVQPHRVGRVLVASATNKGKFLAQLPLGDRVPGATPQSRPNETTGALPQAPVTQPNGELVEMSEHLADDPAQRANLDRFYKRLAERDFLPSETSFVAQQPATFPPGYRLAGTESCRTCHRVDAEHWEKTSHAHAWQTLVAKGTHVDASCQQCHTNGYGLPGGFESPRRTAALVNVGCESCHGPSRAHAADPHQPTAWAGAAANRCVTCHDAENSPRFAYETYWPRIEHGTKANSPATSKTKE